MASGPRTSLIVLTIVLLIELIKGSFDLSGVRVREIPFSRDSTSVIIPRVTMSFFFSG